MSSRSRAAVRWAIAVALVAIVCWRFDLYAVGSRLASVDLRLAVPGIAGLVAVHLVGALTWRRLHDRLTGIRLDRASTIRLYYAAQAVGSVTPGNLGADVYRISAVGNETGRASVTQPIVIQRLTSIAALLTLGGLAAVVLSMVGGASLVGSIILVLLVLGAAVAVLAAWARRGGRVPARSGPSLGVRESGPAARGPWVAAVGDGFTLGLVFHALSLTLGLLLVAAVDPATTERPIDIVAALAVARLSLVVPIAPSGLGVQEGALAILFVGLGLQPDVALAAVLLNRIALVVTVVCGAIALTVGPRVSGRGPAGAGRPARTADA